MASKGATSHLGLCGGLLVLLLSGGLAHSQGAKVMLINISGTIDLGLAPYTTRALREAEEQGAAAVILRIDTPGGRVDAATQIRDALLDANIDTIAFIDREAFSAGALIALASKQIYMTGGAVIGAAAPVMGGQQAGEKYVSAIRTLFRATAELRGRPPEVAEAMVDEDVAIPGLIEKGKLLTLTTRKALEWKVADGQVETLDALMTRLNLPSVPVVRLRQNWAESLVRVLTNPAIAALLLVVGLLALVAEFLAPGFGLGGVVGFLSLTLLFGSHYLVGLAGWEEALLIGAGIFLIVLELLVIPGFGVVGVLGILALGTGLFLSFLGSYPAPADIWRAAIMMIAALVSVGIGTGVMLMFLPTMPFWSRLSLKTRLETSAAPTLSDEAPPASTLLGMSGITLTPLLPSGTGLFGGKRLDIISEGEYIPTETLVTIIHVEGNRLVVRSEGPHPSDPGDRNQKG